MKKADQASRYPLYRQVSDGIRVMLGGMQPGDRLPTEADLVDQFDVSLVTVRQALATLEREGLVEKRQGSGTFVTDRERREQHVAVLLDVDITSDNLSPFYNKLFLAVQDALAEQNIPSRPYLGRLPLGQHPAAEITCRDLLDDVELQRIKGIIAYFVCKNPFWGSRFRQAGIPTLDSDFLHAEMLNEFLTESLNYFRQRNRHRIAFIGWESPYDGRFNLTHAWSEINRQQRFDIPAHLTDFTANGWERGMGWERFRDIWRNSPEKPDALIIVDDMLFEDCAKAIRDLRIRVPEDLDIAISTSDANHLEYDFPVFERKLRIRALAKIVARAMKALLAGKPAPRPRVLPVTSAIVNPRSRAAAEEAQAVLSQG